jgi:hypothetical protein
MHSWETVLPDIATISADSMEIPVVSRRRRRLAEGFLQSMINCKTVGAKIFMAQMNNYVPKLQLASFKLLIIKSL